MVDVTPLLPSGRQVIEAYGDEGFKVSGTRFPGSILVQPDAVLPWRIATFEAVTLESLMPLLDDQIGLEILLLGCGGKMVLPSAALRQEVRALGPVLEAMDTGAACRTYNVLMAEERRVGAALLALS